MPAVEHRYSINYDNRQECLFIFTLAGDFSTLVTKECLMTGSGGKTANQCLRGLPQWGVIPLRNLSLEKSGWYLNYCLGYKYNYLNII